MRPLLALPFLLVAGCSTGQPATAEPPKLEGAIDPSLSGEWSTPDGKSKMNLDADGTSRFVTHVDSGHGPATDETAQGKWRLSGGRLMIQNDPKAGGPPPATMTLSIRRPSPDRLEVQRRTPPQPIVYLRKPKP